MAVMDGGRICDSAWSGCLGSVEGESVRPEIVGVSGVVGFCDESDIATGSGFFADSAMRGDDFWIIRDTCGAIFESEAQWESEFFFDCEGEGDRLDFVRAETFLCAFD